MVPVGPSRLLALLVTSFYFDVELARGVSFHDVFLVIWLGSELGDGLIRGSS